MMTPLAHSGTRTAHDAPEAFSAAAWASRYRGLLVGLCAAMLSLLPGCIAVGPSNPAISVTSSEADVLLTQMGKDPRPLERPVVVLGGYRGPESETNRLMKTLSDATSGKLSDFVAVSYFSYDDLDEICDKIVSEVDAKFPSRTAAETIEVDVVGISLGGLAARWAAVPPAERVRPGQLAWRRENGSLPRHRLNIKRLFTIVSPHQGVTVPTLLLPGGVLADMAEDSGVVATVNKRLRDGIDTYEIIPYGSPRDSISGDDHFAPPNAKAIWTGGNLTRTHWNQIENPIFHADIARRLRAEKPIAEPTKIPD